MPATMAEQGMPTMHRETIQACCAPTASKARWAPLGTLHPAGKDQVPAEFGHLLHGHQRVRQQAQDTEVDLAAHGLDRQGLRATPTTA